MEAAGAEQEVMHEVQIMKHLKHPNVVNLREIIASRENIYLVMEYVPGGDLFDHILKNGAMGVTFCHLSRLRLPVKFLPPGMLHGSWLC